jgi:hypothetical protein
MDAIVGHIRRIVYPFRVSINAKGGYCWHVYRKSVLAIDGKHKSKYETLQTLSQEKGQRPKHLNT